MAVTAAQGAEIHVKERKNSFVNNKHISGSVISQICDMLKYLQLYDDGTKGNKHPYASNCK